ncbi:amidohydrolase family protein [Acuticoccus sp. MNP-M23]|uniref:amidohydrolase family protein n=1 Tax=Acuticoccus sp. MNP-M23 TaxID=3072793 RepID=UPI0028149E19|nr:amidohydrolase family protein [Acuticoccus sp. MNP-M23]WMS41403.1 amidohydrolase family protein [Acuticoccus sp. MNP-M23]
MIIDAHTHTLCPAVNAMVADHIGPESIPYQRDMSAESKAADKAQFAELSDKFNNIERRLADMAAMGVDFQVVAPAPGQQHYWAPPALLAEVSRAQNEHVVAMVAKAPDKFAGIGTLPLTDPEASVAEIAWGVKAGLRAFQIDTRADTRELSDRALDPVYDALQSHGAGLMIHPLGFSDGARLSPFFMVNSVAQPLEELIAFNHLVFGGVLERFAKLKVYIPHGGGFAPSYIGRFDHTWKVRPEVRCLSPEPPSHYLKRLTFDTCVFRPDDVARLVALVGAERVMLGSDYPFDMGDTDPVGTLRAAGLTEAECATIQSGVAAAFFNLDAAA